MLAALISSAQTNTLTFTNNAGTLFSNATVVKIETDGVLFGFTNWQYVPFKKSLNLYWQAADIYVHKMQRDAASLP